MSFAVCEVHCLRCRELRQHLFFLPKPQQLQHNLHPSRELVGKLGGCGNFNPSLCFCTVRRTLTPVADFPSRAFRATIYPASSSSFVQSLIDYVAMVILTVEKDLFLLSMSEHWLTGCGSGRAILTCVWAQILDADMKVSGVPI
jgi:hypothetical protein